MQKRIVVLAAKDQDTLERKGADIEFEYDTIAIAKEKAKYFLTEESMLECESTTRLGYAQVLVNGECRYDFFGKA